MKKKAFVVLERTPEKVLKERGLSIERRPSNNDLPQKTSSLNKKLFPLFAQTKKLRPVTIDIEESPEVNLERQEFTQKGIPNVVSKKIVPMKPINVNEFRTVSHIQQRGDEPIWKKRDVLLTLKEEPKIDLTLLTTWKLRGLIGDDSKISLKKLKFTDLEKSLENIKCAYNSFKTTKIESLYQSYKVKNETYLDSQKMWTEKYTPKSEAILFNAKTVLRLKKWLVSWKNYGVEDAGIKKKMRRKSKKGYDSDDFLTSGEDTDDDSVPQTSCILHGPVGSGKTALVRSFAQELNFHVLEINSSSKRSGRNYSAMRHFVFSKVYSSEGSEWGLLREAHAIMAEPNYNNKFDLFLREKDADGSSGSNAVS